MSKEAESTEKKEQYENLWGAKIMWPADIPDDILKDAVQGAHQCMEEMNADKDAGKIAETLKKRFDEKWGPFWHVTVGRNFGARSVHEQGKFVYFTIGHHAFMLYRAGSG